MQILKFFCIAKTLLHGYNFYCMYVIKTLFHLAKEKGVEMPQNSKNPKIPLSQIEINIEKSPYLRNNDINGTSGILEFLEFSEQSSNPIPTAYTFSDKLKMEDLPIFLHPFYQ